MDALIVDDDDLMADLLETVVAGLHPAITVLKASGFHEALALWEKRKPSLLIVDWNLPDGSGLELVRKVRASDKVAAIVMITGRADRESILKVAHYRINGYISKPFNVEMLHQRLVQMVGQVLPEEPAPLASLEVALSDGVKTVIQLPVKTDAATMLELIGRADELSAAQLTERWQDDASLCSRLLDVANRSSFRRTGAPVVHLRDAIASMGVPMALNQGVALALDVSAAFSSEVLVACALEHQKQAETVALEAQRVALALGKRSPQFFTAGLLSRVGELAVLKVIDQFQRQGGEVSDEQVLQALRDWAQPYGNKLKIQWFLPLELRQLIGAVHYLPRENVTQERLIMRAGALMAAKESPEAELGKILRQLGLDEWHKRFREDEQKNEDGGGDGDGDGNGNQA
ncbi:response regulator [Marinobacter alexandrii]|uniref:response regulator n=1 Tax=Marinobacter alexandrii TaxID=2570351 RepID=UPI001FFEDDEC|nr:response regulator [Marinobacter alexandrii]MCK2148317.1 response regulator [Marinobacter alexandrii]